MKRSIMKITCIFALFAGVMGIIIFVPILSSTTVYASAYVAESDGRGGVNVKKDGKFITNIWMSKVRINNQVAGKGDKIYFTTENNYGESCVYLCVKNIHTGKTDILKRLPDKFFGYDVDNVIGNSVYLTGWNPSDNIACYRYYISSKKLKKIADAGYAAQYKNYIICETRKIMGSWTPYPIYVYNISSKKSKCITKIAGAYSLDGKIIYYAETKRIPFKKVPYVIKKYDLIKGKTTVINKNFKTYYINKITPYYIYHTTRSEDRFYRYNMRTKKNSILTKSYYAKMVGWDSK